VWSFDSLMNLVHCYQAYASEGMEGNSHHFFRQDKLYAIRDQTGSGEREDISIYHLELGGITYAETESSADTVAKTLDKKFFTDSEQDIKTQLARIVQVLKEHQGSIDDGDPASMHIENESADEEMPGKETTDITIDRKLLDVLLR
jgi:hypothetical protein